MDMKEFNRKLVEASIEATCAGMQDEEIFFGLAFGAIAVLETTVPDCTKEFFLEMAAQVYDKRAESQRGDGTAN